VAWHAADLNGLLGHYLAGDELARAIAGARGVDLNTDDRNIVEFGFARSLGTSTVLTTEVRDLARALGHGRPALPDAAAVDWAAAMAAQSGADDAARAIERLRADESGEADVMLAVLRVRQRDIQAATAALVSAFDEFRATPWAGYRYKLKALTLANTLGKASPE